MIIVFLVLLIILAVIFAVKAIKAPINERNGFKKFSGQKTVYTGLFIVSIVWIIILIITSSTLIIDIATIKVIDQKIEMYIEENTKIEASMDALV